MSQPRLCAGFPYYAIKDREHLYTAGSVIYGLYFVVSFPMFYRIDELPARQASTSSIGSSPAAAALFSRGRDVKPERENSDLKEKLSLSSESATGSVPSASGVRGGGVWSSERALLDSLAACMVVTVLLELWRLSFVTTDTTGQAGLPWVPA